MADQKLNLNINLGGIQHMHGEKSVASIAWERSMRKV